MSIIIDIVLVLIVLYFTWRGYRSGLILSVIGIIAIIVSFAAANIVANTYSGEFTGMLRPFVSGVVDKAISGVVSGGEDGETAPLPEEMNDVYTITHDALRGIGLSDSAASKIAESANDMLGSATGRLSERVTDFLCDKLAFLLLFAVAFILVLIIFAAIGNIINLAFSLPGLETLNRAGGAVLGFAKGALILLFIACLFRYLGLLIPEETLEKTVLLEWLIESNKLAELIGV